MTSNRSALLAAAAAAIVAASSRVASAFSAPAAFMTPRPVVGPSTARSSSSSSSPSSLLMSSYDMSDYSSSSSDYEPEPDEEDKAVGAQTVVDDESSEEDVKVHGPVPMSKNAGNRFVALIFDKALDRNGRDWEEMMENRTGLTGEHVRYCREANLYNETFNSDSSVDVMQSYQILSSCATRPIGHILILESQTLSDVQNFIASDPIVQNLGCDPNDVPLYRWRHIKDQTLRIDDGRYGFPNVLIQLDRHPEELGPGNADLRDRLEKSKLEYMIRSERVIAAGPLHMATEIKGDPSSLPVGDVIFFNAKDRNEAIEFAQNDPAALGGLYGSMRVHKYNTIDVTGKFVSDNLHDDGTGWYNRNARLRKEMEAEGYPVDDEQTPWLNW